MKLLIVRHGDPDYDIDSLTEKGWKEVEYLSQKLSKLDVKAFYVSPLGRAKDTAAPTLKKMGRTATECEWLKEFPCQIWRRDRYREELSYRRGCICRHWPQTSHRSYAWQRYQWRSTERN